MQKHSTLSVIRYTVVIFTAQPLDAKTIFLKEDDVVEVECLPTFADPHHILTWYHNGQLIDNFTNLSLTVHMDSEHSLDVFGVYQCFAIGGVGPYAVEEIVTARVLPYGELSGV